MNILLERPVTESDARSDAPPEMLIDFATLTWICAEHRTVMKLDSGEDCPQCKVRYSPPVPETG